MPGSCWESTAEVPSPEGTGWAGRWERQLCSFWKTCEPRPLPRDGGARSAWIAPAAMSSGRRESLAGPGTHPCCPGTCPGNTPLAAGASSAQRQWLRSCCSPGQGTRAVTLPEQEQEPPGLETAVSPALWALAQAPTPQSGGQVKQVTTSLYKDSLRLSAFFKPLQQKPRLHLPQRGAPPGSGTPFTPATGSREVGACEKGSGMRDSPKYGKIAITDLFFLQKR